MEFYLILNLFQLLKVCQSVTRHYAIVLALCISTLLSTRVLSTANQESCVRTLKIVFQTFEHFVTFPVCF